MKQSPDHLPKRKKNRLSGYDYSSVGTYFITFCTQDMHCSLGRIVPPADAFHPPTVQLLPRGRTLDEAIRAIPAHYPRAAVENYVVMPNHAHLLLRLDETEGEPVSVDRIIRQLKRFVSAKHGKGMWQKGYHDHIIRDAEDFERRWQYISDNPARWFEDKYCVPRE